MKLMREIAADVSYSLNCDDLAVKIIGTPAIVLTPELRERLRAP